MIEEHGEDSDLIVANLGHTAPELWGRYWNPGTKEALETAVRTLVAANRVLVQRNEPQFTLLDVLRLFELPSFCHRLLSSYVSDRGLTDWWNEYLEWQSMSILSDWVARVIVPIRRLATEPNIRNIVSQSTSTFDLQERLEPGRITFFNASGVSFYARGNGLPRDLRRWLAALVADRINLTVLARGQVARKNQQLRVVVAVNGDVSIPRIDNFLFLQALHERGASYILSNWSTEYLKPSEPGWHHRRLAKGMNLFVFRNWGPVPKYWRLNWVRMYRAATSSSCQTTRVSCEHTRGAAIFWLTRSRPHLRSGVIDGRSKKPWVTSMCAVEVRPMSRPNGHNSCGLGMGVKWQVCESPRACRRR